MSSLGGVGGGARVLRGRGPAWEADSNCAARNEDEGRGERPVRDGALQPRQPEQAGAPVGQMGECQAPFRL